MKSRNISKILSNLQINNFNLKPHFDMQKKYTIVQKCVLASAKAKNMSRSKCGATIAASNKNVHMSGLRPHNVMYKFKHLSNSPKLATFTSDVVPAGF